MLMSSSVSGAVCSLTSPCGLRASPFKAQGKSQRLAKIGFTPQRLHTWPSFDQRRGLMATNPEASMAIEEGGMKFPMVQTFWHGEVSRALGAGTRYKKIAFVGVKVYAIALYVEAERAAKELGVRQRGGFFADNVDADYALAIVDGAFTKTLLIKMTRKVEASQFVDAIAESLEPRMRLTGQMDVLQKFKDFFGGKPALEKGTAIIMLWTPTGTLELLVREDGSSVDYSKVQPDARFESPSLCRALFEIYLGEKPIIPDTIGRWAEGTKKLLDSENERRSSRKGGSG